MALSCGGGGGGGGRGDKLTGVPRPGRGCAPPLSYLFRTVAADSNVLERWFGMSSAKETSIGDSTGGGDVKGATGSPLSLRSPFDMSESSIWLDPSAVGLESGGPNVPLLRGKTACIEEALDD